MSSSRASRGVPVRRGPSLWRRFLTGDLREGELALALLLPAALVLGGLFLYPVLNVLWTSLHFQKLTEPWKGTPFVGLENFAQLFADPAAMGALGRTLGLALLTVTGSFLVGLPFALLANVESGWRWLVRVALLLPWAMPQVLTALMFAWMFNGEYGVFNDLIRRAGLEPQRWLSSAPGLAVAALVLTVIWKTSSFVALILLGGLQAIPSELSEAAAVDGATPAQTFWRVTLPLLRPAIAVALIFRTLSALQLFDIPYALTGGGPGQATETLGILVHRTTLGSLDFGYGAAQSVVLFGVSLLVTAAYLRWIRPEDS